LEYRKELVVTNVGMGNTDPKLKVLQNFFQIYVKKNNAMKKSYLPYSLLPKSPLISQGLRLPLLITRKKQQEISLTQIMSRRHLGMCPGYKELTFFTPIQKRGLYVSIPRILKD